MRHRVDRFVRDQDGATMVEYAMMVALIALVCIVAVGQMGGEVLELFSSFETELAASQNPGVPAD